ncbi:CMGC/CDK/CDK9 protein kinase [Puccinia graminis f. sp. tritici CRL 75-36-700-3]|uniref:[RNA-polymerase]-subunit kinase n=1 Tax=Puccinia graminis f. sp. tritici (strain CRL 75-36-700-3 / race SCCL) TaxID=418459 RepID=E3KKY3_PUCGT|nr:CMGC/CDK/CDK9 protein kinase [Puccinia graminis f. sp. tritici CRL 75-36-700-3]EFP84958.2 CMGC/CDK/CDK9 protein kinase [Puccinia graminis f. sp. tritici CRL 75-36-700-3]
MSSVQLEEGEVEDNRLNTRLSSSPTNNKNNNNSNNNNNNNTNNLTISPSSSTNSHHFNSLPPKPPTDLSKIKTAINPNAINALSRPIHRSPNNRNRSPVGRSNYRPTDYPSNNNTHNNNNRLNNHLSPSSSRSHHSPAHQSRPPESDSIKPTYLSPDQNRRQTRNPRSNRSHSPSLSPTHSASRSRQRNRSYSRESSINHHHHHPFKNRRSKSPRPSPSSHSISRHTRNHHRSPSISRSPSRSQQPPNKRQRPLSPSPLPSSHPTQTTDRPINPSQKELPSSPSKPQNEGSFDIQPSNRNHHDHILHPPPSTQAQSNPQLSSLPTTQLVPSSQELLENNLTRSYSNDPENSQDPSSNPSNHPRSIFQNYQPTFFFCQSPKSRVNPEPSLTKENGDSSQEITRTESSQVEPVSNGTTKKCFVGVSSIRSYELVEKLGEGTFGEVFKGIYRGRLYAQQQKLQASAQNTLRDGSESCDDDFETDDRLIETKSKVKSGMVVALKRIIVHNELDGLPITALREIRILKSLDHPNIVPVIDLAFSRGDKNLLKRGNTYMVFPYIDHDLAGLMENKSITFNVSQIKLYSKQLLLGTAYLHRNKILHRDLKAANLLISNEGQLMIADFGLARSIEQQHNNKKREYTNCVVTRWYRPPEILLGNRRYGTPVDLWGVGCVIAEMFKGGPILTGSTDVNQCELIFRLCGSPTSESMPGWENLPGCEGVRSWTSKPRRVREEYERISPELADLLDHLLVLDHSRRLTAEEALDHDWFWTDPMAIDPAKLPHYEPSHEYDRRKKQEQAKKTHQHQLASFTEIQGTSSMVPNKINGSQPAAKPHRLPLPASNSRPPPAFLNENPFPSDPFKHPIGPPNPGNRIVADPGPPPPFHRAGLNHAVNPYSSQGSSVMMNQNEGRGDGDHRQQPHSSSRRMRPEPNRGGPMGSHPYPGPPPNLPGGQAPPLGNSAPSIASYGHASLPSRPVTSFDRGPHDPMRLPKPGPPMSMIGGMNGAIGGMPPGPPYAHSHGLSGHPEPYALGPPPPMLPEHGSPDERGQRGEPFPKMGYSAPLSSGQPIRDTYGGGGGFRGRDGGRADGRFRSSHDRWTPEPNSQLGGPPPPGISPYSNGRSGDRRQAGRGGERRFRHGGGGPPAANGPHDGRENFQYNNNPATPRNSSSQYYGPQNGPSGGSPPNPYSSYTYPPPGEPMATPTSNPFSHPANNSNSNNNGRGAHQNGHPNQRWENKPNTSLDFRSPPSHNNNPYNHHHPHHPHHQPHLPLSPPNLPLHHHHPHPHSPPNGNGAAGGPSFYNGNGTAGGPSFSDEPRLEY